jgi:hypothetical protein
MQNGRLLTEKDIIGPYGRVHLNSPPTSATQVSVVLAEAATLARGKHPWATVAEVANLARLAQYLCHPESGSDPASTSANVATQGAPEF